MVPFKATVRGVVPWYRRAWARTGMRVYVWWLRLLAWQAHRDADRQQRAAEITTQAWYRMSEGLPLSKEQRRSLGERR